MPFQIPYNLYEQNYRYKYMALYHALRDIILAGTLPLGSKLPATRELASEYGLSRGVVSQVYEMLASEGYLASEVGRGTFVSFNHERHPAAPSDRAPLQLSDWGRRLDRVPVQPPEKEPPVRFNFTIGRTATNSFPFAEWNRTLHAEVRSFAVQQRQEAFAAQGHLPLRESIARYLGRARGMDVEADDVVIVNGSMQAIALLAQLLVNPGDPVVMEDPGYRGIKEAVHAVGGEPIPAPVDREGLVIEDFPSRLLFVTPSRHFPTGAVLSLARRQELLQWAIRRNAVIVEDDFDSEFRHQGRPIEPLSVLDQGERVVYIGTFSKTLFSDIRLGYVVLPHWLREPFLKARYLYEPHPTGLLQQRALAQFMNSGQYERHLRRMKREYARKHKACTEALREGLPRLFDVVESDAGLHVFAWWKGTRDAYHDFRRRCREGGILWPDSVPYAVREERIGVLFGFAHLSVEELRAAVTKMAEIATRTQG